jgi:hypothetical protein
LNEEIGKNGLLYLLSFLAWKKGRRRRRVDAQNKNQRRPSLLMVFPIHLKK